MKRVWILGVMAAVGLGSQAAGGYRGGVLQQRGVPTGNATQQGETGIVVGNVRNPYTKEPIDSVDRFVDSGGCSARSARERPDRHPTSNGDGWQRSVYICERGPRELHGSCRAARLL
jgi:hypothetical protein